MKKMILSLIFAVATLFTGSNCTNKELALLFDNPVIIDTDFKSK